MYMKTLQKQTDFKPNQKCSLHYKSCRETHLRLCSHQRLQTSLQLQIKTSRKAFIAVSSLLRIICANQHQSFMRTKQITSLRQCVLDKDKDCLFCTQLDSFTDNIHKLPHGQISRYKEPESHKPKKSQINKTSLSSILLPSLITRLFKSCIEINLKQKYTTDFFLSILGTSLLSAFSTITCNIHFIC